MSYDISRIYRRVINLLVPGIVSAPAVTSGKCTMIQVQSNAFQTQPLPLIQQYGFASVPLTNAQVLKNNLAGDNSNSSAIASHDPRYYPANMQGGESQMHDNNTQSIYLKNGMKVVVNAKNEFQLLVNGTAIMTATSSQVNFMVPVYFNGVQFGTHTHSDVQAGEDDTGPPVA